MTLVKDPTLVKFQVSMKIMIRTLRKEKRGFWVEINRMEAREATQTENNNVEVLEFLTDVVKEQQSVFAEPEGLPPPRGREHSIRLKAGSNPVGVWPYRYPQSQKYEIERMIQEMLKAGF